MFNYYPITSGNICNKLLTLKTNFKKYSPFVHHINLFPVKQFFDYTALIRHDFH